MTDYHDIRQFKRLGRHLGQSYVVFAMEEGGKFFVSAIDIAAYPRMEGDKAQGFDSLEEAMDQGRSIAEEAIEEL